MRDAAWQAHRDPVASRDEQPSPHARAQAGQEGRSTGRPRLNAKRGGDTGRIQSTNARVTLRRLRASVARSPALPDTSPPQELERDRPRCYSGASDNLLPGAGEAPGPTQFRHRPSRALSLGRRSRAWSCRRPTCRSSRPRRATTATDSRCTGHAFSAPSRRAPRVCANYNASRRQPTPACVTPRDATAPTET